jgi:hypothetical protein
MNSKKLYYILIGVVVLLVGGLVGGAYGSNMLLQGQAQKLVDARSKSAALELQQAQLAKAKASVIKYDLIGKVAKSVVPQDKNQAQTVRELVTIANKNGIKLANISFPSSTLGTAPVPGPVASGAAPATPATPATPKTDTTNLSQLLPLKTISGVYTLQIVVQSDSAATIPYDKFISFLADLENNRRTALVSGITLSPDAKDATKVSFALNLDEYIKP